MEGSGSHPSRTAALRRTLRRTGLIVASVVVALFIGEALVFILHRDNVVLFPRRLTDVRYGGFHMRRNAPNASYKHKSVEGEWEFSINENGFRDTCDFDYAKPETTLRILVLGDSHTIGYEAYQDATYSAVLGRYLRGKGLSVEILNAGMAGSNTAEQLIFLEQEGVRYHPDFVILGFSGNDLAETVGTDLFRLQHGELFLARTEYVPGVNTMNRLNAVGFYRWLGEHSWLLAYLNGLAADRYENAARERSLAAAHEYGSSEGISGDEYMSALARMLVGRMCEVTHSHEAELLLLNIPVTGSTDSFPWLEASDQREIADVYLDSAQLLSEYEGLTDFTVPHGGHWTPFVHVIVGVGLGREIIARLEPE